MNNSAVSKDCKNKSASIMKIGPFENVTARVS